MLYVLVEKFPLVHVRETPWVHSIIDDWSECRYKRDKDSNDNGNGPRTSHRLILFCGGPGNFHNMWYGCPRLCVWSIQVGRKNTFIDVSRPCGQSEKSVTVMGAKPWHVDHREWRPASAEALRKRGALNAFESSQKAFCWNLAREQKRLCWSESDFSSQPSGIPPFTCGFPSEGVWTSQKLPVNPDPPELKGWSFTPLIKGARITPLIYPLKNKGGGCFKGVHWRV